MPIHGYPGNVITANPVAPTSTVATGVWTTEQQLKAVAAGNWPVTIPTQQISRSLRFNSADSAYLSRTPSSSPTSNQKFTISCWFKRTALGGTYPSIYNANDAQTGGCYPTLSFSNLTDALYIQLDVGGTTKQWTTTQVFRDLSAWYHIVWAVDTTQATATDRMKLYINGSLVTAYSTQEVITQNGTTSINATTEQRIGSFVDYGRYLNGFLTEFYMVDGQQLAASSFGRNNVETGVWEPLAYTGTYGTNGFYLNFSDNSGTTSTTLGKDSSGNGNNWTPNNFSVTAGAGNDSLVDSPTSYGTDTGVGGEVRGNYCTLNPLSTTATLADGNLNYSSGTKFAAGTIFQTSGKFYAECVASGTFSAQGILWGFSSGNANMPSSATPGVASINGTWYVYSGGGLLTAWIDTAFGSNYSNPFTVGQTWQFAVDVDNGKAWLGQNNTWYDSSFGTTGNPSTGANPTFTISSPTTRNGLNILCGTNTAGGTFTFNFGQRAFAYTAPSGFKALCTQNLPTPTIGATSTTQANDYFNTILYNGNGNTGQTVTGVGFQPDFLWLKNRNQAGGYYHCLFDSVRGAGYRLKSNSTDAEANATAIMSAFTSDGFTFPAGQGNTIENDSAGTYVAWNWKANGAGSSNTAGTITSTVSANTTSGFSIVTYTGNNTASTVGHGLGVAPRMVIVKLRSTTGAWGVYHGSLTAGQVLYLNLTDAVDSSAIWNSTAPTSTVFSVGAHPTSNPSGQTLVAYCFAPVAGYSAFGSYTGNGSTDGTFVYTGFRPRWILIKNASAAEPWNLVDTSRDPYNVMANYLQPNSSGAEGSITFLDGLSNGFKLRSSAAAFNGSGNTMIYACFAENPFKYSLAR